MSDRTFSFDGEPVSFVRGQTVGAALIATGVRSWRHTRGTGSPRGLFCGIGVCFDCLLVIDGAPNQRACLVVAREESVVSTQQGSGRDDLAV